MMKKRPSRALSCFFMLLLYVVATSGGTSDIIKITGVCGMSTTKVKSLTRYAIKGLGGDDLTSVTIREAGETFPNDRRYALIKSSKNVRRAEGSNVEQPLFDPENPIWIHKEHFLCAFSAPALMATFDTECIDHREDMGSGVSSFTVWKRLHDKDQGSSATRAQRPLLDCVDLTSESGKREVSNFFSNACGEAVEMVTAIKEEDNRPHRHQFGNTSSGWKQRQDTRTVHIVNASTIRQLSDTIQQNESNLPTELFPLRPSRFRPNIVLDGLEPWKEFEWVGKTLKIISANGKDSTSDGLQMQVLSRTVRCDGIGIDPLDDPIHSQQLDMPKLINRYFPEHGPYLGVYAAITQPGTITLGDQICVLSEDDDDGNDI